MKMIRLLTAFLVLSPLYITFAASPVNLRLQWNPYENPTGTLDALATISGECKIGNNGTFVPVGSASSAVSLLDFTFSANPGDPILCDLWATENGISSARSAVAQFNVPFPVPATPQGARLVAR